jgi:heptosyltransferase I
MAPHIPIGLEHPPDRLCLIRISAIGDTCHTVPVVRAIQDAWPDTRITWIIGKLEHSLMRGMDGVDFIVLDKSLGWRSYLEVRRQLGGQQFPLLLHMHPSQRANITSLLVSAPIRLGYDRASAKDFQYLFCNRQIPSRPNRHVMDLLLDFLEPLGIERSTLRWDIPVGAEDIGFAEATIDPSVPSLIISPCAVARFRNFRNWPAERYAAIAAHAKRRYGASVYLTGGTSDVELEFGRAIERGSGGGVTNLIGRTSLKQLLALIARAHVLICGDSGPAHMATAVRTPVVGLYATTNRHRAGPYFSQHLVVDRYPDAVLAEFGAPVEAVKWGQRVRDPEAMKLITIEDVEEKLLQAFGESGIAPTSLG